MQEIHIMVAEAWQSNSDHMQTMDMDYIIKAIHETTHMTENLLTNLMWIDKASPEMTSNTVPNSKSSLPSGNIYQSTQFYNIYDENKNTIIAKSCGWCWISGKEDRLIAVHISTQRLPAVWNMMQRFSRDLQSNKNLNKIFWFVRKSTPLQRAIFLNVSEASDADYDTLTTIKNTMQI